MGLFTNLIAKRPNYLLSYDQYRYPTESYQLFKSQGQTVHKTAQERESDDKQTDRWHRDRNKRIETQEEKIWKDYTRSGLFNSLRGIIFHIEA